MKALKTSGPIIPPRRISSFRRTNINISFVGSGNVATHLAHAFHKAGCCIAEVWSRNGEHAAALASQVGAKAVDSIESLDSAVDFCVVAVSDDALPAVAKKIRLSDSIVVHTSGTIDREVLRSASPRYGVLWSPMSFVAREAMDYSQIPFCIEGCDETTAESIEHLARQVGSHVYRMDMLQRRRAHLSAVMANNFGNALLAEVQRLSAQWNLPFEILQPIIMQTARRAGSSDLWQRQTGPAARRDQSAIDTHRAMLRNEPGMLELYDAFTRLIMQETTVR